MKPGSLFSTAVLTILMLLVIHDMTAQVPLLINYQARLVNPGTGLPVTDGVYNLEFSIYDMAEGGIPLWSESQSVQITNGIYSVLLGSLNPLDPTIFEGSERYLGVKVGSDPEMTPRKQMVSVPYAIHAETAERVSGTVEDTSMWKKNLDNIYYNKGNVGIGTSNPEAALTIEHNGSYLPDHLLLQSDVGQVIFRMDDTGDNTSRGFQFRQVGEMLVIDRRQDPDIFNSLMSLTFGQYKNITTLLPLRINNSYSSPDPMITLEHDGAGNTDYMRLSSSYFVKGDVLSIKSTGNIGVGTPTPDSSAALEIKSHTQGFLPPRMTQAQRDSIKPVEGLIIYNLTTKKPNYFDGTDWKNYDGTSAASPPTDADGNVYTPVVIGTQTWMVENLKSTKYRNGDIIGTTIPANMDISLESTPKYQWPYDGNEAYVADYGRLYTWYAITDSRNVCPSGWHVPNDNEWTVLAEFLEGANVAGGKLKETGVSHWNPPNTGASNESGFTALPGGGRYTSAFGYMGGYGHYMSADEIDSNTAGGRIFAYDNGILDNYSSQKKCGFSVRCIKDAE